MLSNTVSVRQIRKLSTPGVALNHRFYTENSLFTNSVNATAVALVYRFRFQNRTYFPQTGKFKLINVERSPDRKV